MKNISSETSTGNEDTVMAQVIELSSRALIPSPPTSPGRHPLMKQRWEDASFLHWPVDASAVAETIHPALTPDTMAGTAWVGLVPFHMVGIGWRKGPAIPRIGTFPETNIRTYVIGPEGPGVWFNSLEASRLAPVVVARLGYRLPYFYAAMRMERDGNEITYNSIRRWPSPRGAGGTARIMVGEQIDPTPLDIFLTARWRLYTEKNGQLFSAEVRHPEWPLYKAAAMAWDDELARVAGYPPLLEQPHTLYSPGVPVDVWRPERVA